LVHAARVVHAAQPLAGGLLLQQRERDQLPHVVYFILQAREVGAPALAHSQPLAGGYAHASKLPTKPTRASPIEEPAPGGRGAADSQALTVSFQRLIEARPELRAGLLLFQQASISQVSDSAAVSCLHAAHGRNVRLLLRFGAT